MPQTECAHIISHTHWDREWYLSSRYVNVWLVPFFQSLFDMLEKEPGYRFVLDGQTCLIEDWCEQLALQGKDPAPQRLRLAQYVRQRRLLVGPYYIQLDWQLAGEEALVRNLLIGHELARELGAVMPVGWLVDNFGQISQAPQIHRQFDLDGVFLWRGVELPPDSIRSEFTWASPDGSSVTAIYLLSSYRNAMRLAEFAEVMRERVQREVAKLAPFASTQHVLLMNGYDQELAPDDILPALRSGAMGPGVRVLQSTPEEYLAAITRERPSLPKLTGALYSGRYIAVFPGTLSSRMYLKTMNDACHRALQLEAEPLATLLWCLGQPYPAARLRQAWKLLLKNLAHDSICGVSVDDVHSDMEARFATSAGCAHEIAEAALGTLAANVDTTRHRHASRCWVVVNTALRPGDGLITLPAGPAREEVLYDSAGQIVPVQQGADGRRTVFVTDVPPLGYVTLFAAPPSGSSAPQAGSASIPALSVDTKTRTFENEFVRVSINPDGTLALTDKCSQETYPALAIL